MELEECKHLLKSTRSDFQEKSNQVKTLALQLEVQREREMVKRTEERLQKYSIDTSRSKKHSADDSMLGTDSPMRWKNTNSANAMIMQIANTGKSKYDYTRSKVDTLEECDIDKALLLDSLHTLEHATPTVANIKQLVTKTSLDPSCKGLQSSSNIKDSAGVSSFDRLNTLYDKVTARQRVKQ